MTPQAPSPQQVASAQSGANTDSAIASSYLSNIDQTSPFGSVDFSQNGFTKYKDSSGKTVKIPNFSSTTTLSPEQQALYDRQVAAGKNIGDLAVSQSGKLNTLLSDPMSTSGLPAQAGRANYGTVGTSGLQGVEGANLKAATTSGLPKMPGQVDLQDSIGPANYSTDRLRVEDAIRSRANPEFDRRQQLTETKLVNQGLTPGSEAWRAEMDQLGRDRNDSEMQAILAGGSEQSRMAGLDLTKGNFANTSRLQEQGANLGLRTAAGSERLAYSDAANRTALDQQSADSALRGQQMQERLSSTGFNNQAAQQRQTSDMALRNNALQERYALRNQPINEITALLSGSQVTAPSFAGPAGQNVGSVPIGQYMQDDYRNQMSQYNSNMSGLFGLGSTLASGLFALSDRRAKKNIRAIGKTNDGQNLYRYEYKGSDVPQIGLMAQEVLERHPEAVAVRPDGLLAVDYAEALREAA
jgi:hypothetical protein